MLFEKMALMELLHMGLPKTFNFFFKKLISVKGNKEKYNKIRYCLYFILWDVCSDLLTFNWFYIVDFLQVSGIFVNLSYDLQYYLPVLACPFMVLIVFSWSKCLNLNNVQFFIYFFINFAFVILFKNSSATQVNIVFSCVF